jgi:hypothetical protein
VPHLAERAEQLVVLRVGRRRRAAKLVAQRADGPLERAQPSVELADIA